MKRLVFLVLLGLMHFAYGQDVIYTQSLEVINAEVVEIGLERTRYIPTQFPNGPIFEIANEDLYRIRLRDERIIDFERSNKIDRKLRNPNRLSPASGNSPLWLANGAQKGPQKRGRNTSESAYWVLKGTYNRPLGDFNALSSIDGDRAQNGYGIALAWHKPLFSRFSLGVTGQWEGYEAVFDTSLFGLNVGGLDFLNIEIAPSAWQSARLGLVIGADLVQWRELSFGLRVDAGAWALREANLKASSRIAILTTQVSNKPNTTVGFYYGGGASLRWNFSERWALRGELSYLRSSLTVNSDISVTTFGQSIPNSRTTEYQMQLLQPSIGIVYRLK